MKIMKTSEYFGLSVDELLERDNQGLYMVDTKEEYLLSKEGQLVVYYDDIEDMNDWEHEREGDEIKAVLETINGRIAVVIEKSASL